MSQSRKKRTTMQLVFIGGKNEKQRVIQGLDKNKKKLPDSMPEDTLKLTRIMLDAENDPSLKVWDLPQNDSLIINLGFTQADILLFTFDMFDLSTLDNLKNNIRTAEESNKHIFLIGCNAEQFDEGKRKTLEDKKVALFKKSPDGYFEITTDKAKDFDELRTKIIEKYQCKIEEDSENERISEFEKYQFKRAEYHRNHRILDFFRSAVAFFGKKTALPCGYSFEDKKEAVKHYLENTTTDDDKKVLKEGELGEIYRKYHPS